MKWLSPFGIFTICHFFITAGKGRYASLYFFCSNGFGGSGIGEMWFASSVVFVLDDSLFFGSAPAELPVEVRKPYWHYLAGYDWLGSCFLFRKCYPKRALNRPHVLPNDSPVNTCPGPLIPWQPLGFSSNFLTRIIKNSLFASHQFTPILD